MQHMVLHNPPTLPIGTERLACLNSPPGVQLGSSPSTRQVPGLSPGWGGHAASAFFLCPPFLPPSGDSFFRTFPTNPAKVLALIDDQLDLMTLKVNSYRPILQFGNSADVLHLQVHVQQDFPGGTGDTKRLKFCPSPTNPVPAF